MLRDADNWARSIVDACRDDGARQLSGKALRAAIAAALRAAYADGDRIGEMRATREACEAAGLCHGLSSLDRPAMLQSLRTLRSGGRVIIRVENEQAKPLRIVS